MSFIKSSLLGSAAVLAVVVGAQAADLPSKKAAPATYVKICDAYGAGFFYLPGTETCVRLGGYVRSEYQYVPGKDVITPVDVLNAAKAVTNAGGSVLQSANIQSTTGFEARGRIDVDARTPTEMGVARTFIRLRAANTSGIRNETITDKSAYGMADPSTTTITAESALVQWAGFTFGIAPENYAMMPSFIYNANPWAGFPNGMKQIAYTANFGGGLSATIALEDHKDQNYEAAASSSVTTPASTAVDTLSTAALIVANVRMDQAWGWAAVHGAIGNNGILATTINSSAAPDQTTYSAYAFGVTASFKLPMIAAGDQVWFGANYAKGMLGMLLSTGGLSNMATASNHRLMGGVVRVDNNLVQTGGAGTAASPATYDSTTGWNLNAAFTHYWAAQWRSNFSAGYVSISPPTSSVPSTWGGGKLWEVTGGVIYSPVKDLDIGLELQYANLKNTMQNPTAAFVAAGQPGLSVNNVTVKFRAERGF